MGTRRRWPRPGGSAGRPAAGGATSRCVWVRRSASCSSSPGAPGTAASAPDGRELPRAPLEERAEQPFGGGEEHGRQEQRHWYGRQHGVDPAPAVDHGGVSAGREQQPDRHRYPEEHPHERAGEGGGPEVPGGGLLGRQRPLDTFGGGGGGH